MRQIQVHTELRGAFAGTSFRSMVRRQAEKLHVTGWVLQHPSGDLEAVFNGSERAVHVLLGWCERGPMAAAVDSVTTTPQPREAFFGFSVRTPPPAPEAPEEPEDGDDLDPDSDPLDG